MIFTSWVTKSGERPQGRPKKT